MKVKNTWLSRLLVRMSDNAWLVTLWFIISPFLIIGPIRIVQEIKLRKNSTVITAHVINYNRLPTRRGEVAFLFELDGKYYVNSTLTSGVHPYKINETIVIIVNKEKPSQSHIWNGN